jgi:hypothetical protein
MVRGLDQFKKYFEKFSQSYVIIGGTACDIIITASIRQFLKKWG